jgi:hypothetical protein
MSLDLPHHVFYVGSMRNIEDIQTKRSTFLPNPGEKTGMGGGGVDPGGTSHSEPDTTSCVRAAKRRRGAQPGNGQALKHGAYAGANLALKRQISTFIRQARDIAEAVEVRYGGKPRRRRRKAVPA